MKKGIGIDLDESLLEQAKNSIPADKTQLIEV